MNTYYFSPHCPFWPCVPVYSSLPYLSGNSLNWSFLYIWLNITYKSNNLIILIHRLWKITIAYSFVSFYLFEVKLIIQLQTYRWIDEL